MSGKAQLITVGRVGRVCGLKGWVYLNSFTSPPEQIIHYGPWYLKNRGSVEAVTVETVKPKAGRLIAKFAGVDDRERAALLVNNEIQVDKAQLPTLAPGEYYWHQLEGLEVICEFGGRSTPIGRVQSLIATGANDVLVVKGTDTSVDRRERLIPYIEDQVIKSIDVAAGKMVVDWDPHF